MILRFLRRLFPSEMRRLGASVAQDDQFWSGLLRNTR